MKKAHSLFKIYLLSAMAFSLAVVLLAGLFFNEYLLSSIIVSTFIVGIVYLNFSKVVLQKKNLPNIAALYIPLCNTFPAKLVRGAGGAVLGKNIGLLFTLDTILFLMVLIVHRANFYASIKKFVNKQMFVASAFVLIGFALVISSSASVYKGIAIPRSCYLIFLLGFSTVVYRFSERREHLYAALEFFAASCFVVMLVSFISILSYKNIPIVGYDFLKIKMDVDFMEYLGITAFGNSTHMAAFALLVNAVFAPLCYLRGHHKSLKRISLGVTLASILSILFVYSRSALLLLFIINIIYIFIFYFKFGVKPYLFVAIITYLLLIHLPWWRVHQMHAYYSELTTLPQTFKALGANGFSFFSNEKEIHRHHDVNDDRRSDRSFVDRFSAMTRGVQLIEEKGIWGVGLGTYAKYDSKYTSPHNYILLLLFEIGWLGLVGFVLLPLGCLVKFISYLTRSSFGDDRDLLFISAFGVIFQFSGISAASGIPLFFDNVLVFGYIVMGALGIFLCLSEKCHDRSVEI